jgi:hypothetical protein
MILLGFAAIGNFRQFCWWNYCCDGTSDGNWVTVSGGIWTFETEFCSFV